MQALHTLLEERETIMSADLYLGVVTDLDQFHADTARMDKIDLIAHYAPNDLDEDEHMGEDGLIYSTKHNLVTMLSSEHGEITMRRYNGDSIWVGQYSSLGYALTGDEKNIPASVRGIFNTIGEERPVKVNDALITRLMVAMNGKRDSHYERRERVTKFVDGRHVPYFNKHGKRPVSHVPHRSHIGVNTTKAVKRWPTAHKGDYVFAYGM